MKKHREGESLAAGASANIHYSEKGIWKLKEADGSKKKKEMKEKCGLLY